jgi:hypothetical protein
VSNFRDRIEYIQKSGDEMERSRMEVNHYQTKGELTESYRGLPGYPGTDKGCMCHDNSLSTPCR